MPYLHSTKAYTTQFQKNQKNKAVKYTGTDGESKTCNITRLTALFCIQIVNTNTLESNLR